MANPLPDLEALNALNKGTWKRVTTEQAFEMLTELNQSNRPIRNDWIKTLKIMMNEGTFNWKTPDPVCISEPDAGGNKKLLNAQHRLTAFVESDLEEGVFFIIDNLDESVYETMDQGQKRSPADFFCNIKGTKKSDRTDDGELAITRNKHVVRIALNMERMANNSMPTDLRFNPAAQARLAVRYERIIRAILQHYKVKKNLAYATPVASAFANASLRYGLLNVLPLVRAYCEERWRDTEDREDPLKKLHRLIRDYNAKDKQAKKRVNTRKIMYAYAMNAISTALCAPEHWIERLSMPKKARNFGDNVQREAKIRQSIDVQPEPEFTTA